MLFLAQLTPPAPSSLQVGVRALVRASHQHLSRAATVVVAHRQFHAPSLSIHATQGLPAARSPSPWLSSAPRQSSRAPRTNLFVPRTQTRTIFSFRAIVHYSKLPLDYEDAAGIPFRKEDLTQREVNEIFGPHLKAESANQLLRIIHGRRVAGTLEDPGLQINTASYKSADKVKALLYLRKHIPVNEIAMAGLRAEDELKAIEAAEKEKEHGGEEAEHQHEETSAQTRPTGRIPGAKKEDESPYGEGHFDRIRKANIAKREAEEKRLEEERIKREEEEALGNIGPLSTERAKPREISPWMQKQREQATSDLQAPPDLTTRQRLGPMVLTALLICGLATLFAVNYQPPRKTSRLFPEVPPAAATCLTIIALNLAVWGLWKFPPAWKVLNKYFLIIAATPRPLQLVGAMFSHQTMGHLAMNMGVLWFFGTRLHDSVGRGDFLALYFTCGTVGFLASLTDLVLRRGLEYTTHGASGAVYGLIAAYFWMHKFDEFKLFGYPSDPTQGPPGLAFIGLIMGIHIAGLLSKKASLNDLMSHIGGMAMGIVGAEAIKRHSDYKTMKRMQRMHAGSLMDPVRASGAGER
ncbi:rhomboid-like protein [Microdochium nivale]|nr:rhomboid-like protein [Microdochium nivale]